MMRRRVTIRKRKLILIREFANALTQHLVGTVIRQLPRTVPVEIPGNGALLRLVVANVADTNSSDDPTKFLPDFSAELLLGTHS